MFPGSLCLTPPLKKFHSCVEWEKILGALFANPESQLAVSGMVFSVVSCPDYCENDYSWEKSIAQFGSTASNWPTFSSKISSLGSWVSWSQAAEKINSRNSPSKLWNSIAIWREKKLWKRLWWSWRHIFIRCLISHKLTFLQNTFIVELFIGWKM